MIREFENEDIEQVMQLWLNTNIQAHHFIPSDYWIGNYDMVKEMLPNANLYVYELESKIEAFIGVQDAYIAGIFVSEKMQSKGIGKDLLEKVKSMNSQLSLTVYKANTKAVQFYEREQFVIKQEQIDENTGKIECVMEWCK